MACQPTGSDVIDRLISGYALEADIYESLLDVAREQGALLEEGRDIDRCTALFERKDELLRSLACIEQDIEPLKRRCWTEDVAPGVRDSLNALLDSILNTIEAIMEQEQRNEQLLRQSQQEVAQQLGHIRRGSAMHRTQAPDDAAAPRFMDIRH